MSIALPGPETNAGVLVRMFLAENRNPGHAAYDAAIANTSMQAMRATVENRLKSPGQFMAPGATTWLEIITAKKQFEGFSRDAEGKLVIAAGKQAVIDKCVAAANAATGKYPAYVQKALEIAKAANNPDPFAGVTTVGGVEARGGSYGFMTVNWGSPGDNFLAIPPGQDGVLAGNQFFTLKKKTA